ncbi:MAG: protein kinase [Chloroflexi bacterium]|nr:protein kinase [Chloroflexota bacterium]
MDERKPLAGRYRILREIGTGGMARVFVAEDTALGRRVALKVLHPQYAADQGFVARFEREARAIAALSHPGIVDVYDVGTEGGNHFIVMQLVEGKSAKDLIRRGEATVDMSIDIGVQIATALDYAHRAGMVHRDVKPHNILVSSEGAAKLVDFGIAVARGSASLTEAGSVLGTAHYLSPEQARGAPATPASDLYSLGVVLYEIATGRLPFEGESAIEIATKHVTQPPPPPSRFNPAVPPSVERAILHAMEKDPGRRPSTGAELARELLQLDDFAEQPTRLVRAAEPNAPPLARVAGTHGQRTGSVVGPAARRRSETWPIVALGLIAFILVLGLVPLCSAALQGGGG